jgi:hypothetical protein
MVPTPRGLVTVEYRKIDGMVTGTVEVPGGVDIVEVEGVELPVDSFA